jgi:hypothetical protein
MGVEKPIGVAVSKHVGRLAGVGHKLGQKDIHVFQTDPPISDDHKRVHIVLSQHISMVKPNAKRHMNIIEKENPSKSRKWLTDKHNETFAAWVKDDCDRNPYDPNNDADGNGDFVYKLAQWPLYNVRTYQAYDMNGYTFYTEAQERRSVYLNSGVILNAYQDITSTKRTKYYGVIEEIWVLDYTTTEVPMFRVRWGEKVETDDNFTTVVIPKKCVEIGKGKKVSA